jgi:hypothetical protein
MISGICDWSPSHLAPAEKKAKPVADVSSLYMPMWLVFRKDVAATIIDTTVEHLPVTETQEDFVLFNPLTRFAMHCRDLVEPRHDHETASSEHQHLAREVPSQ